MPRTTFQKPALPIPGLIDLMERRGMILGDRGRVAHYLQYIGYYRLSGYWYAFQRRDGSDAAEDFRHPISFDDILNLYVFDRKLRVLLMDALERIEVAVRATISDTMSLAYGPHWFMERENFSEDYDHDGMLRRITADAALPQNGKPQTQFIAHYYATYSTPRLPPSWMVFEVISFGTISRIFKHLHKEDQKRIAALFDFPPQRLASWFHALTHLRNLCAHHERVWNRIFGVSPSVPKDERDSVDQPKKFYVQALVVQILLDRISEQTNWGEKLAGLIAEHPEVNLADMGFPQDWKTRPVWGLIVKNGHSG
jgi:abortive infection bacteriophage resistance protein